MGSVRPHKKTSLEELSKDPRFLQPHSEDMNKNWEILAAQTSQEAYRAKSEYAKFSQIIYRAIEAAELQGYQRGLEAAEKIIGNIIEDHTAYAAEAKDSMYAWGNKDLEEAREAIQSLREKDNGTSS